MKLNAQEIKMILPHRYPFLLVDKVLNIDLKNNKITAQKNVTVNEHFFAGHFSTNPIMPGVLAVEAMAQAVSILGTKKLLLLEEKKIPESSQKIFTLVGINKTKIKRFIVPGDILLIHASITKVKQKISKSYAEIRVNDDLVASSHLTTAYRDLGRKDD